MACRRRYRWRWADKERDKETYSQRADAGGYIHPERLLYINPELNHAEFWETVGHEFIHAFFGHKANDEEGELVALRHEKRASQILHDLFTSRLIREAPACGKRRR